jgi:hypothetical protein
VTLAPMDSWQVRGVAGPKITAGSSRCSAPDCGKWAEHAHHLWRRSMLGGPFSWVELPDGTVVCNLTGLCADHHDEVTGRIGGHKSAIRRDEYGVFWWCALLDSHNNLIEYAEIGPLDPQPPTRDMPVASPATRGSEDSCSTCGQPLARRRPATPTAGRRRVRKTWPVKIPADAEENGAEVLDTLTEDLAPLLGLQPDRNGSYASARYFVLAPALYYVHQHRDEFVASIKGLD